MAFNLDEIKATLEAALQRVSQETGLPPAAAIAMAVLAATLLVVLLIPRRPGLPPPPKGAPQPRKKPELGEISLEELAQYDGTDPSKPVCVAIKGVIYDVSRSRHLYGPDGGYSGFAGKDASRALAKMSMDPTDAVGDLTGLSQSELDSLAEWEVQYQFKYDVVGKLVPAGGKAAAE